MGSSNDIPVFDERGNETDEKLWINAPKVRIGELVCLIMPGGEKALVDGIALKAAADNAMSGV